MVQGGQRIGGNSKGVPHRAFGPVRNDKGCWWGVAVFAAPEALLHPKTLRGAYTPFFHGWAGGVEVPHFKSNFKRTAGILLHGQLVEIPFEACGAASGYGVLRLRMTSTSWASCFAQDDRRLFGLRPVGFDLWFVAFGVILVYAGLDGYCWGIGEWGIQ